MHAQLQQPLVVRMQPKMSKSFHFSLLLQSLLAISRITAVPLLKDSAHEESLLQKRSAQSSPQSNSLVHDYITTVFYHKRTWDRENCKSTLNCIDNLVAPQVCSSEILDFYPAENTAEDYSDYGCLLHFEVYKTNETRVTGLDFSVFTRPDTDYRVYLIHFNTDYPKKVSTKYIGQECGHGWQMFHTDQEFAAELHPGLNSITLLFAAFQPLVSEKWITCSELRKRFYIDSAIPFNSLQRRAVVEATTEPGTTVETLTTELPAKEADNHSKIEDINNKETPTSPSQTDNKPVEHSEMPTVSTQQSTEQTNKELKATTASPKGATEKLPTETTASSSERPTDTTTVSESATTPELPILTATTEPGTTVETLTTELPAKEADNHSKIEDINNKETPTSPSQTDNKPVEHSEMPTVSTQQSTEQTNKELKATTASPKGATEKPPTETTASSSERPTDTTTVSESTTTPELPILTLEERFLPIITVFLNNVPPLF